MIFNSRMIAVLLLGFSSGIPLALTDATLQAWMTDEKIDIARIGLFSLVAWPYAVKFVWAPFLDRFLPPTLDRRRGWILIAQIALATTLSLMAFSSPSRFPIFTALIAFLVAFSSASQDIVVDAYRSDVATENEVGPASSAYIIGYRVAYLISNGGALILADHFAWRFVYLAMAGLVGLCVIATLCAPGPPSKVRPPQTMKDAIWLPFREFLKRTGSLEILAFVVLFKIDTVIAQALLTPFIMSLQFSKTDVGAVMKTTSFLATIFGTLIAGRFMMKFGIKKSLWTTGLLQGVSGLSLMYLAHVGHSYPVMVFSITVDFFFSAMGIVAYSGFLLALCDKRFSATQYALLTSLMAITRVLGKAPTGFLVKAVGWEYYYLISVLAMIPGLLILLRYDRWQMPVRADT